MLSPSDAVCLPEQAERQMALFSTTLPGDMQAMASTAVQREAYPYRKNGGVAPKELTLPPHRSCLINVHGKHCFFAVVALSDIRLPRR